MSKTRMETEADQLRALIKEAHEAAQTVKDAIAQYNRMMEVHDQVTAQWIAERVERQVQAGLDGLHDTFAKSIEEATAAIYKRFDTIADRLVGSTKRQRKTGNSLEWVAEQVASDPEVAEIWEQAKSEELHPGVKFFKKDGD